ncbi:hypothetical protein OAH12_01995 [Cyclobacteriaceae bacterium]|nr:hypothetical protein [Cyclobacteriaceae bacterium]
MNYLILLPPAITITLALWTKEVFSSLLIGIIIGVGIIHGFDLHLFSNFLERNFLPTLANTDHLKVIIFSLSIGGIASLLQHNGGINGLINIIEKKQRTKRSIEFYTYFLGLAIFFDDYANTLITGNAMQKLFDKYKISREKLALIVDTTSAPITSIAFVTTWIGFELSQIETPLANTDLSYSAYDLFLGSLKFAFYPILMLSFIAIIIWFKIDIGSIKNTKHIPFSSTELQKGNILKLIIPILFLILSTLYFLIETHINDNFEWSQVAIYLGKGDPFTSLFYSSLLTLTLMILWETSFKRSLKTQLLHTAVGFKHMFTPVGILILAWMFGQVMKELEVGLLLAQNLQSTTAIIYLPVLVFLISAGISFTTGSSFGTMSIVYPLIIPIMYSLAPNNTHLMELSIASVLGGSVFGDHCSPISDTTIMSSMASGVDHISHVKTQLPYALIIGVVSAVTIFITSYILY